MTPLPLYLSKILCRVIHNFCMRGNGPRGVVVRGNCPRGSCPMGVIVLWGSCPRDSCPQGSCPRGSCPRGSCPRTRRNIPSPFCFFLEKLAGIGRL